MGDGTEDMSPFEPMPDTDIAANRKIAKRIGKNNVTGWTWKRATKEQEARGWVSQLVVKMEAGVTNSQAKVLGGFIGDGAHVLMYALDSLAHERVRAQAAEAKRDALRAAIAADLRAWAEQGGDPWMVHVADEVAAGRRPETDNNNGAEGREGVT